jgi:hypothetical protein
VTGSMGGAPRARARLGAGTVATAAVLAAACSSGAPALDCAIDTDCGSNAFCASGQCLQGMRTCPALEPRLSSIDKGLFRVSCGISGAKAINCHSRDGAGSSSGLDLSTDPYGNLVNHVARNLGATMRTQNFVLVTPGDDSPEGSFLIRKLQLIDPANPLYGSGMPADAPGSICAESVAVVRLWIAQGAQRN